MALTFSKIGMQNGDVIAKSCAEFLREHGGQRDFRHKHQRSPPSLKRLFKDSEVNLSLSAPCHSPKKKCLETFRFDCIAKGGLGRLLLCIEVVALILINDRFAHRVPTFLLVEDL